MRTMIRLVARTGFWCTTALLLAAAGAVDAQSIYKCSQAGQTVYTDHACPNGKGELIHQASDSEILDQYLDLGQASLAEQYANTHRLEALYADRLASYQQKMQQLAQQQADAAMAEQHRAAMAQRQALVEQAASYNNLLRVQNAALAEQNAQLSQPSDDSTPAYWGADAPPYWSRPHDHDHDHSHPVPPKPAFHPCTTLPGGRVMC